MKVSWELKKYFDKIPLKSDSTQSDKANYYLKKRRWWPNGLTLKLTSSNPDPFQDNNIWRKNTEMVLFTSTRSKQTNDLDKKSPNLFFFVTELIILLTLPISLDIMWNQYWYLLLISISKYYLKLACKFIINFISDIQNRLGNFFSNFKQYL